MSGSSDSGGPITRRTFTAHLAGGTVLASTTAAATEKADDKCAGDTAESDLRSAKPFELLLALVQKLDPDRLTAEHLEQLRLDVEFNLLRSAALSRFPLTNADEPVPRFAAWRAEDE
ncbi:MAG TPA: hypothetical protein VHC22_15915 [Pirellulales bacterium]|nr:hypothetical protein [Pirellulales bacterium]